MVMKRNAMHTNLRRSIRKSLGRYIAIAMIIALGAGLFVGLRMTKADMVETGQQYMDRLNMFDLRLVTSYGWGKDQLEEIARTEGVVQAEGMVYLDLIARQGGLDSREAVYRFHTMPEEINRLVLLEGRMPENPGECLADAYLNDESILGSQVVILDTNEEASLEAMKRTTFTVVGLVSTPLYMDMNRGTTSVGNGSIANYYFIPADAVDADYYSEIHVTIGGNYEIYSDAYQNALEDAADAMEPRLEELAQQRYESVKQDAEEAYQDGYQEYLDGLKELEEGSEEAKKELEDAYQELQDGEETLENTRRQLVEAGNQIEAGRQELEKAREELTAQKKTIEENLPRVEEGIRQLKDGIAQAEAALGQLGFSPETLQNLINTAQQAVQTLQTALEQAQLAGMPEEVIAPLRQQLQEAQTELNTLNGYFETYASLKGQLAQLEAQKLQMEGGLQQIEAGFLEIDTQEGQLDSAYNELMRGWGALREGQQDLADGWVEYEDGKLEAEQEIADGEQELADAAVELEEARADIDAMPQQNLHILDRTSNIGYTSLDSSSDIVEGVSRVFPAFFLLVAALVCITTMTRMVDEERTQIGTLKALGYSNGAIISKYMLYAGSSAVLGCGIGVFMGSAIFPMILWEAYKILLFIPGNIALTFDWGLCLLVVTAYAAVELGVTWYCCHRTLTEVPAELIRPKAPTVGKQLLFEKLPFWKRVSFLNKVTIRNIFRYRQRLAMMLVGIGGCTALLLTGFGLRDSIVNIVDFQFEDITVYDMSVYFSGGQTEEEQQSFAEAIGPYVSDLMFYHQSSVEILTEDETRDIYMIAAGEGVENFIDFHSGDTALPLPGVDEVMLSVGVAENLGIGPGDMVTLRNSDLETLELTVCGLYDNYVYNYAIVAPQTMEKQWGETPEKQMAFIMIPEGQDSHQVSAEITAQENVMNVSVNEDLAGMVGSMMDALDLVVIVVVVCAGLLGATVLYNLTNININERIREIATIKVLGFNATETAMYIFKENLALSFMGAGLGLLFGRWLLDFVMSQIKIDFVWFQARILPPSFLWSVVLTILTALLVDFVFYFRLEKINMAEALKSVE